MCEKVIRAVILNSKDNLECWEDLPCNFSVIFQECIYTSKHSFAQDEKEHWDCVFQLSLHSFQTFMDHLLDFAVVSGSLFCFAVATSLTVLGFAKCIGRWGSIAGSVSQREEIS